MSYPSKGNSIANLNQIVQSLITTLHKKLTKKDHCPDTNVLLYLIRIAHDRQWQIFNSTALFFIYIFRSPSTSMTITTTIFGSSVILDTFLFRECSISQ